MEGMKRAQAAVPSLLFCLNLPVNAPNSVDEYSLTFIFWLCRDLFSVVFWFSRSLCFCLDQRLCPQVLFLLYNDVLIFWPVSFPGSHLLGSQVACEITVHTLEGGSPQPCIVAISCAIPSICSSCCIFLDILSKLAEHALRISHHPASFILSGSLLSCNSFSVLFPKVHKKGHGAVMLACSLSFLHFGFRTTSVNISNKPLFTEFPVFIIAAQSLA